MTRKRRMSQIFSTDVIPAGMDLILLPTPGGTRRTSRVWKLVDWETWRGKDDNWTPATKIHRRMKVMRPNLGWAPKIALTQDTQLCRRNQWTSTLELQLKTRKEIQRLFLLSSPLSLFVCLSPHDILFLFLQLLQSTYFHILFLSPDNCFKSVVAN